LEAAKVREEEEEEALEEEVDDSTTPFGRRRAASFPFEVGRGAGSSMGLAAAGPFLGGGG